ncbi:MAG TPA: CHASE3 domain-containing protein [Pyrinomonadaceae bacterium]|nr:CHASE3 domain-containing protein [Pyrinomonadaceae bacterium]
MKWLKTFLKWRWIRLLLVWNHAPIRAQGGILALIPIIAVLISFVYAFYGNRNREFIEYDIQRRFKIVRQYNDLLNLMLDAETGERGFLLTERDEYLEPYRIAVEKIPTTIASLRETISEEPGEKPREERLTSLATIEQLINEQLISLKLSQDFVKQNRDREALYNHLQNGKRLMDAIRQNLGEMQTHDGELLKERIEDINGIRRHDYIFVFVALLIGLIMRIISFYLFDRGIVRRINRLTENVGSLIAGKPFNHATPKKDDAIGLLEQEIVKIGKQNNLDTKSD